MSIDHKRYYPFGNIVQSPPVPHKGQDFVEIDRAYAAQADALVRASFKPATQTDSAISQLDALTDELSVALSRLVERLQPVLTPAPPTAEPAAGSQCAMAPAPLVSRIDRQSARVRTALDALRDIEARLAV